MGSNLRRQLREALPPSVKGLQRAVALEIADDARWNDDWKYDPEKGRRSKAKLADIVRWTAAKDELSVREMLRRLSVAGWEFRLPIGKGKDGRLLYAVPGMAMQFRVPDFEAPTVVGPSGEDDMEDPTSVGPSDSKGPTVVGEGPTTVGEGPTVVGEGPTVVGPPSPSTSPCSSPKDSPSTTSVAEDSATVGQSTTVAATEGGGGGEIISSEDQKPDNPTGRAEAFIDTLDFRGKQLGLSRRAKLSKRIAAALEDGWTERGLKRYLDISDDPGIRDAGAVYAHRLKPDELPAAAEEIELPPACNWCLVVNKASEFDASLRQSPLGGPCQNCHPDFVAAKSAARLPPLCENCAKQPGADINPTVRIDPMSFTGEPCPHCHPSKVPGDWNWLGKNGKPTGARAAAHTAADYASSSVDDLYGPRILPGDRNAAGWMALSRSPALASPQPQIASGGYQPYRDAPDDSGYDKGWPDPEPADDSIYEKDL